MLQPPTLSAGTCSRISKIYQSRRVPPPRPFDIAEKYGKDTFLAIHYLGSDWMPELFALKGRLDALAGRFRVLPRDLSDKIMQTISRLFPQHLPKRMKEYRDKYEHHLLLKMAGESLGVFRRFLQSVFPSTQGAFFECTDDEGEKAFLHRFAAAGAAIRYRAIHRREVEVSSRSMWR